jgi:hypothetical protein
MEEDGADAPPPRKVNRYAMVMMKIERLRAKLHSDFKLRSWSSSKEHRPLFGRGWKLGSSTTARVMHLPSPPPELHPRNPKSPPPHPYSFVKPHYTVASTAGVRTAVTVERQGSIEEKALVSVVVCAVGSDGGVPAAEVGVDFLLMHSQVAFQPGKRSASVPLLILANPQGYVVGSTAGVGPPGIPGGLLSLCGPHLPHLPRLTADVCTLLQTARALVSAEAGGRSCVCPFAFPALVRPRVDYRRWLRQYTCPHDSSPSVRQSHAWLSVVTRNCLAKPVDVLQVLGLCSVRVSPLHHFRQIEGAYVRGDGSSAHTTHNERRSPAVHRPQSHPLLTDRMNGTATI